MKFHALKIMNSGRIVNKNILGVKVYQPGKPIAEVKRELGLKEVIKLASNESPFGPSPKVLKAISREAKSLNRYPDGGCFLLRRALAKRLGVKEDQLIFGNGSDEVIVMAIRAFVSPGDEVIVATPSFLVYEIAAKTAGAVVRAVPLNDLYYDLDGMRKAVTEKTKIVFIGNPDNPSGTYVSDNDLKAFLNSLPTQVLVFIDEAYYEFVKDKDYPDSIELLKTHQNIIVTRTFSKMYGLAGLRVGYGISTTETIDYLNRVREPFNINSLAQVAAVACLEDQAYYQKIARFIRKEKLSLYKGLGKLRLDYKKSATNFILVDVKEDSTQVANRLLKKGVIIRDMNFWGMKNVIRITVGTKQENQKLLKVLKEIL